MYRELAENAPFTFVRQFGIKTGLEFVLGDANKENG